MIAGGFHYNVWAECFIPLEWTKGYAAVIILSKGRPAIQCNNATHEQLVTCLSNSRGDCSSPSAYEHLSQAFFGEGCSGREDFSDEASAGKCGHLTRKINFSCKTTTTKNKKGYPGLLENPFPGEGQIGLVDATQLFRYLAKCN